MPNGGYVLENVITLCGPCHLLAEAALHAAPDYTSSIIDYSPSNLYRLIGSSRAEAEAAARSA